MEFSPPNDSKNIVINSHLTAGGDIHIGDKIYQMGEDFRQSILFLRIVAKGEAFSADLSLKTRHPHLKAQAAGMLHQELTLKIPESLFDQVNRFQEQRRNIENARLQPHSLSPAAAENQLSDLIYQHFFGGDIGTVLRNFIAALQAHKIEELLLVISSPDTCIRNLPWEMTLDRLCVGGVLSLQGFGLVRTSEHGMNGFDMSAMTALPGPLKMLFVTALPENLSEGGKKLELEDEQQKLIRAVGHLEATGDRKPKMVIEFLDVASVNEIAKALRARDHDVLHISGHGGWLQDMQQGVLYLEDDLGDRKDTSPQALADVLRGLKHLKLVVLSACETAIAGEAGTENGIAGSGVPAVVAMRFAVGDAAAKAFTTQLYEKLVQGNTITEAMAAGRLCLLAEHARLVKLAQDAGYPKEAVSAEWFTPVLYLNQYVGNLVDSRHYHFPDQFYTHSSFIKESHTKLIGGGFIGRKRQRIAMRRAFQAGEHVCLVGMGGMGKTTLAEAFARNFDVGGHRLIIWRGDKEITELGILSRIIESFKEWQPNSPIHTRLKGIMEDGQAPILKRLEYLIKNCLAGEKTILIFDNFEDLQWQELDANARTIVDDGVREMLNHLLLHAPQNCHILFTTRYRIEGLPEHKVHFLDLDKLSEAEQYRLMNMSMFLQGIGAEERTQIYKRLDGLPLAYTYLESFARHGVELSWADLEGMAWNDANFSWKNLQKPLAGVPSKVFANLMLGRIYGLLSPELQRVFLVASVFFTRTPVEALVALTGDDAVRRKLEGLMGWSLCFYGSADDVFEVHALTREWVVSQGFLEEGERRRLALGAGEWFETQKSFAGTFIASNYFESVSSWNRYASVSLKLIRLFVHVGMYQNVIKLSNKILEREIDQKLQALLRHDLGKAFISIGRLDDSKLETEVCLQISKDIGDMNGEAAAYNNLANIYLELGDYDKVLFCADESLRIAKVGGDQMAEGYHWNMIGMISSKQGDYIKAGECYEKSVDILSSLKEHVGVGRVLNNLGENYLSLGDIQNAEMAFHESLKIKQEIHDRHGEAAVLSNLGSLYKDQNNLEKSLDYYQKSLDILKEIGARTHVAILFGNIGQLYTQKGEFETASSYLHEGLNIHQANKNQFGIASSFHHLGNWALDQKSYEAATKYFAVAEYLYTELGSPFDESAKTYLKSIVKIIGEVRYKEILATIDFETL